MGRDIISEHCRVGLKDLDAVRGAPDEIQTIEICFEDFLADAKKALNNVYILLNPTS